MKKINALLMVACILVAVACGKKKTDDIPTPDDGTVIPPPTANTIELSGNITSSMTLDATKKYLLKGKVYVQAPSVLTVPAGTIVFGDKATQGTLIINRGAQLIANGTASQPIIFTSSASAGFRNRGDWGGVIILGNADNNRGTNVTIEGISAASGENGLHGAGSGSPQNTQSSGSLKFVRIEYAGIPLADDNELNSLTLGSVGSGTTFENIMVSYANDDAYEWFGGSANAKFLIAFSTWDDDFDTDQGFTGKVQFGLVVRDPAIADKSGSRVFESSSNATAPTQSPVSAPVFSNITVLGPLVYARNNATNEVDPFYRAAVEINTGSAIKIHNSIFVGHADQTNGTPAVGGGVFNSVSSFEDFAGAGYIREDSLKDIFGSAFAGRALVPNGTAGATDNRSLRTNATVGYNGINPAPLLDASSPYLTGAPSVADFTSTPAYYGAFGSTPDAGWNWTAGWVNFNPNNATY
jgi:hypothetical protein